MSAERLQKLLARAGHGSRRACEQFILDGRVTVDGTTVSELGARADPETQDVALDGEPLRLPKHVYWLLNKPRGCICTADDEQGRPRAVELVPERRRVFTVGRLDEDSEGALVVTNDGELAHRLTHPRFGVERTYRVHVSGAIDDGALRALRAGVYLAEGKTAPCEARIKRRGKQIGVLEVTIRQGLNRQVRRMLSRVGLKVRRLVRTRIGPIKLGGLAPGQARRLSPAEVQALWRAAGREPQPQKNRRGGREKPRRQGKR